MTVATSTTTAWFTRARPWLGVLARLVLGGMWLYAGATKVTDLAASGRGVYAYQLTPYELSMALGAALPFIELALGALLVLGLATRLAAGVSGLLLAAFVAGTAAAWARGLRIDCGCFGTGGELAADADPTYGTTIARNLLLIALAVFLVVYPVTRWSVDRYVTHREGS